MGDKKDVHKVDSDAVREAAGDPEENGIFKLAADIGWARGQFADDTRETRIFQPLFSEIAYIWEEHTKGFLKLLDDAGRRLQDTAKTLVKVADDYDDGRADNNRLVRELEVTIQGAGGPQGFRYQGRELGTGNRETNYHGMGPGDRPQGSER